MHNKRYHFLKKGYITCMCGHSTGLCHGKKAKAPDNYCQHPWKATSKLCRLPRKQMDVAIHWKNYLSEIDKFCLPKVLPSIVKLGQNCNAMLISRYLKSGVKVE